MNARTVTLGIDLAAQPKETAACLISWKEESAEIEKFVCPLDDAALLALIDENQPAKVAIDAPFGWPTDFVDAVSAWHGGGVWSGHPTPVLRLRLTDRIVIQEARQQPLSVSSDRIAVTAWRCAGLLTRLSANGIDVARDGSGLAAEVYPAAALRRWQLDPKGYKGSKPENKLKREQLVTRIVTAWRWCTFAPSQEALLKQSDHQLDAFLSAVMARVVEQGRCRPLAAEERVAARHEGWIHLPESEPFGRFNPC